MSGDSGIRIDYSDFENKMKSLKRKVESSIDMFAATEAQQLQAYMKTNRPWTDRTGEAKRQLSATVSKPSAHETRITLAHGVYYGIYLEFCFERRYAIIQPTLLVKGEDFKRDVDELIRRILS